LHRRRFRAPLQACRPRARSVQELLWASSAVATSIDSRPGTFQSTQPLWDVAAGTVAHDDEFLDIETHDQTSDAVVLLVRAPQVQIISPGTAMERWPG
jgi:hypothetical protein